MVGLGTAIGGIAYGLHRVQAGARQPPSYVNVATASSSPSITLKRLPISFSMYAGETKTLSFSIPNRGPTITPSLAIVVTSVPSGGSAYDITLTHPSTVTLLRGTTTMVTITIAISQSAVLGAYVITTTVSGG